MNKIEEERNRKRDLELVAEEKARTKPEKYSYTRLGGWWHVVPLMMAFSFFLYALIHKYFGIYFDWPVALILLTGEIPILVITSIDEKWDAHVRAKQKIKV